MKERVLNLHVEGQFFDEIKAGEKQLEYRRDDAYWQNRLVGKTFDCVCIAWGYPAKDDLERRLYFKWKGYGRIRIVHPFFDNIPTNVFSIDLTEPLDG